MINSHFVPKQENHCGSLRNYQRKYKVTKNNDKRKVQTCSYTITNSNDHINFILLETTIKHGKAGNDKFIRYGTKLFPWLTFILILPRNLKKSFNISVPN